jgi:hypothetical protein
MTKSTIKYELTPEDARRVAQALRNEAHQLENESERACEKGFDDYGTLLWEECSVYNELAGYFHRELPE